MKLLDEDVYKMIAPIQICANQAAEIEKHAEQKGLSNEEKQKLLNNVTVSGAPVDALCVCFTYPKNDHIELTDDGVNTYVTLDKT